MSSAMGATCRHASSDIERQHHQQRAADQQAERYAASDRENAIPAISGLSLRLGPGSGMVRRSHTDPKVTHGLASATLVQVGHLDALTSMISMRVSSEQSWHSRMPALGASAIAAMVETRNLS
jgi:hypothetical protein